MLFLYCVLATCCAGLLVAGIVEQRRHDANVAAIPTRVPVNGIRGNRVERNGQMGALIPQLDPDTVFLIGHPTRSAADAVPAHWTGNVVDLGGDRRDPDRLTTDLLARLGPDSSLVAIGNIHGQGELLLERLAALPPDNPDADPADPGDTPRRPAPTTTPSMESPVDPRSSDPADHRHRHRTRSGVLPPVLPDHEPARGCARPAVSDHPGPSPRSDSSAAPRAPAVVCRSQM
ncbi:hypothetical protein [Streptomyces humidus]